MADIFMSYAREDWETAKALAQALAEQGWSVWWDRYIRSGRRFHDVIERELTAARCVIALWSTSALSSLWVREEAQDGLDRDILVPAMIETVQLPIGFRTVQTADLIGWEGDLAHPGFTQLIEDITAALGESPAKPEKPAEQGAEPEVKKPVERRGFPDFAVFRDIDRPWCPEMVALPAGTFLMGSPEDEKGRFSDEGPQHRVTIGYRFAIGRYPVTFAEYDHFCAATKREKPGDSGWGRGRRPVINVTWQDATAYCDWLVTETRKPYRLPSEAEWEYACRAGTTTRYWCGDTITKHHANKHDGLGGKTTEVRSYSPNPWGLHDTHGNVWEWVEDVWHECYEGAPADGAPWTDGDGKRSSRYRVLRGGSWRLSSRNCRSANRGKHDPADRDNDLGFRVARSLD